MKTQCYALLLLSAVGVSFGSSASPFAPPVFTPLALQVQYQGPAGQGVAPPAGHAWYAFANHTHTNYSVDASATVEQRIRGAAAEGADAIAITDHGNMDVCSDPMFMTLDGCVPMCGEEWGSDVDGDAGLLNPSPGPSIGGAALEDMIPAALTRGATIIANHPFIGSEPWTREDLNLGITGIEIVTTPVYVISGYEAAVTWWQGFLAKGRIVFGIGGSDNHTDSAYSLQPANYVLSMSPQPNDMQDALEAGRISISQNPSAGRCLLWCDTNADGTFETPLGSNVAAPQSRSLAFRVEAFGCEGYTLVLFTKSGQGGSYTVGTGNPWVSDLVAAVDAHTKDFLRAEIRTGVPAYPLEAITNSIYVNYTPDDADSDGVSDAREMEFGTDYYDADSDDDGISDGYEVGYDGHSDTYNPYDPITNPTGTDLNALAADTDGDHVDDALEITGGSNPLDPLSAVQVPVAAWPAFLLLLCAVAGLGAFRLSIHA